jgi:hypothetical protein
MKKIESIQPGQAGFRVKQFARACGISRTTIYALPEDQKPKVVRIGRAVVIVETPAAFLQRLAQMQQETA